MRARRAVRPCLDAMENRIALSGLNAHSLLSSIHLPFVSQQQQQHHAARPDANRRHAAHPRHPHRHRAGHHPVLVHTHGHAHPKPKSSSTSSNMFSQFFKSAFGGL